MEIVGGTGWEIKLLPQWIASEDGDFITLVKSENGGAVTISAIIDEEEDISLDELEIYSRSKLPKGTLLEELEIGGFKGFTTEFKDEDDISWLHCWLAFQDLLIYFSYNGEPAAWESEKGDVCKILKTLETKEEE